MQDETKKVRPFGRDGRGAEIPADALHTTTYSQFHDLIARWGDGRLEGSLVVVGGAGLGKSEAALKAIGKGHHLYLKGKTTAFGVYLSLYEHIDAPVVLDDVDSLLVSGEVTSILKPLLETKKVKVVQWTNARTMAQKPDADFPLPQSFSTTSRTLILANELRVVSKNFGALMDRCTVIWFRPDAQEVHEYVGTWFDRRRHADVYKFVGERLPFSADPSCRTYVKAVTLKEAGLPWEELVGKNLRPTDGDDRLTIIARLLENPALKSDKERIVQWHALTGESENSFRAYKRTVQLRLGIIPARSAAISAAMKKKHAERRDKK